MEELVSIIVPIYKVEQYLERCINSIINQTYKNLEIILVDDGSPDGCPKICDEYAKKDNRIKVIHKKNGGVSSARNVGLNNSTGKYITFIDSDDCVDKSHIQYLYEAIKKYNADIACCGFIDCYEGSEKKVVRCPHKKYKLLNQTQILKNYYDKYCGIFTVPWDKLYLSSIFKDLSYDENMAQNEDSNILMNIVSKTNKLVLVPHSPYFYLKRQQSLANSAVNQKRVNSLVILCENRVSYMKEHFPKFFSKEVALRLTDIGSAYKQCADPNLKETLKNMFNEYWSNYKKYLSFRYKRTFKCYFYRFLIKKH